MQVVSAYISHESSPGRGSNPHGDRPSYVLPGLLGRSILVVRNRLGVFVRRESNQHVTATIDYT
jgi:hypothetical protein